MLIDNTNKIIFIHIPKTAGSSINSLLLSSNFELIFPSVYSSHNKKHIILRLNKHKYPDYIIVEKSFSEITDYAHFYNELYSYFLENTIYKNYRRFCIIRNPYDRAVSAYYYKFKEQQMDVKTFIHYLENISSEEFKHKDNIHLMPQSNFIQNNDILIHFEYLQEELKKLQRYLPLDFSKLIHSNQSIGRKHFLDLFDKKDIEIINKVYKNDFKLLNYKMIQIIS